MPTRADARFVVALDELVAGLVGGECTHPEGAGTEQAAQGPPEDPSDLDPLELVYVRDAKRMVSDPVTLPEPSRWRAHVSSYAPPLMQVARHSSALGAWEMASMTPLPRLQEHVRRYCGYWERTTAPLRRREVPSADVTLIISFGPEIALLRPTEPDGPADLRTSFVAGIDDAYAITEHAGEQHGIEVNLSPLSAGMLLGVPMGHVGKQVIELEDLLGPDAERLTARLYEAASWEARFALLDAVLSERLDSARAPRPGVAWAWRSLLDSSGQIPIGWLASELGWSHRRLTTRFREEVGVAPKLFARILRFERALGLLKRDDGRGYAEIAYSCGYADQAHFNRDFHAFAGSPPGDFLSRRLPDSGGFAG